VIKSVLTQRENQILGSVTCCLAVGLKSARRSLSYDVVFGCFGEL